MAKFEKLLFTKQEDDEQKAAEAKKAAEDDKFNKLQQFLIDERQARVDKETAKRKAADDAAAVCSQKTVR